MVFTRYISINFDKKFNRIKVIIHLFLETKRRERKISQRHFKFALINVQKIYLT